MLRQVKDPRHQSYITYKQQVLLMTRIVSSIFYISSMRKTSEEFNNRQVIENIGILCREEELEELPYWETVNNYLARLDPEELQEIIYKLVRRLLRMRVFEQSRIRGKYWQIILDGTQLYSSREELPGYYLYRVHNRGTDKEYREYYYYVLEAKLILGEKIVVSIMTEFVENEKAEVEKQDCERKAAYRLIDRLKKEFPRLPICLCGDSLYACGPYFEKIMKNGWKYIVRYKEGSVPSINDEYQKIRKLEGNLEQVHLSKKKVCTYDHVNEIDYEGKKVNLLEYREGQEGQKEKSFYFVTNLVVSRKNRKELVKHGRDRWLIENQGFNDQKTRGYELEHRFSKSYRGMKNHYYLIQIGHMISQIIEAVEEIWEKQRQSREQKHKRLLEAFKVERLQEYVEELEQRTQIRLIR